MIVALAITTVALFVTDLWLVTYIVVTPIQSRISNRRLRWTTGDHVEDVRNRASLAAQLSLMGPVNTVAGAFAGLGASMYVVNSEFQFTTSLLPVILLGIALVSVQFGGLIIGFWASRPLRAWITNPLVLEATLRRRVQEGPAPREMVDDFEQNLADLRRKPSVRGLKTADDLMRLGMQAPAALEEWPAAPDHDSAKWTKIVRHELDRHAGRRWLWHGHRRSFLLPLVLGSALAFAVAWLGTVQFDSGPIVAAVLVIAFSLWHLLLAWLGSKAVREDLVLTNRQDALVRAKLSLCAELILALRRQGEPATATSVDSTTLVVSIGRWQLRRGPRRRNGG
ncbi:hypothetical protein [Amycolatopsis sp. NPDC004378]